MTAKGGRVKRAKGWKALVQRCGRNDRVAADREEKGIETRERRLGKQEAQDQRQEWGV